MRVAHVTDAGEAAADELAPLVEALGTRGVGGEIVTTVVPRAASAWVRAARELRSRLAPGQYDAIHAHGAAAALTAALAQRRLPVVAQLRDELHDGGRARIARWAARLCGHVLVPDAMSALRVGAGELRVLPIGVDVVRFAPLPRAEACAALRLDPARRMIAAEPSPACAEVMARVQRALPDAVLMPIDVQAPAERPALLNAADVLLVAAPSPNAPRLVRQALACNTPVVAVRTGDVSRLVARVFPSAILDGDADALAAATIATLRTHARSDGRSAARHITIERTADALVGYYAELLALPAAAQRRGPTAEAA